MGGSSEFIKKTRKKLKISQEKFAKKIGYSRSYVRDVESGKAQPSRSFLEKMSMEFNVSVDSLLNIDPLLTVIDQYRDSEYIAIPYFFGFTQSELDDIEEDLKSSLVDRNVVFVDGSICDTPTKLIQAIMQEKGSRYELFRKLQEKLANENTELLIVIKKLSKSKLTKKTEYITDIFKTMYDACDFKKSGTQEYMIRKKLKSCLILIDFPSFLEKYHSKIGLYTVPVLVHPSELFMKKVTISEDEEGMLVVRMKKEDNE